MFTIQNTSTIVIVGGVYEQSKQISEMYVKRFLYNRH